MPINFPDTPTLNQEFTVGDRTWTWDGSRWESVQIEAKNAYELAIDNGFVGTEQQWLDSLVGEDGDSGVIAATSPLSYDANTQTVSIDLSDYKLEINQSLSSNITLVAGYRYFVNTSAARTLTLPATPAVGDEIQLFDATGTGSTNNVTINNNSNKINGVLDSAIIDIDGFATVFVWTGSTYGWRMI